MSSADGSSDTTPEAMEALRAQARLHGIFAKGGNIVSAKVDVELP